MTVDIYKFKATNEQYQLFLENKLYVNFNKEIVYRDYNHLVSDYKRTKYVSIDDFMIDNDIINIEQLRNDDVYYDITKYQLDDNHVLLIVAICS
jgi:hypothetical protein